MTVRGELKVSGITSHCTSTRATSVCSSLYSSLGRFCTIRIRISVSSKERARGCKLQFPSTFQLASLPGTERPYRGLRSRWLTTRSWPDVCTVPPYFAASVPLQSQLIFALSLSQERNNKSSKAVFEAILRS
jgi:hypothetical protein